MSFHIANQHDAIVIRVEGQLVASNRQQLKMAVADELQRGSRKFVIDFAETGYIDSAGLGVLVSLAKQIRDQSAELRLANLNEDLRTLFELTRLDTLFNLDRRENEARLNAEPSGDLAPPVAPPAPLRESAPPPAGPSPRSNGDARA